MRMLFVPNAFFAYYKLVFESEWISEPKRSFFAISRSPWMAITHNKRSFALSHVHILNFVSINVFTSDIYYKIINNFYFRNSNQVIFTSNSVRNLIKIKYAARKRIRKLKNIAKVHVYNFKFVFINNRPSCSKFCLKSVLFWQS